MEDIELLVHVSAPARRQDDKRYLALAQSIIDFEPAPLREDFDHESVDSFADYAANRQLIRSFVKQSENDDNSNIPYSDSSDKSIKTTTQHGLTEEKANHGQHKLHKTKQDAEQKDTFHDLPQPGERVLIFETPKYDRRPRTAPDTFSASIKVPRTGPTLRRTQSESTSFGSLASHISNSQPSPKRGMEAQEANVSSPTSVHAAPVPEDPTGIIRNLSQASLDEEQTGPKRRKLEDSLDAERTQYFRPNGTEAYLMRDRSLDWTSSPSQSQSSKSESDTVTQTPSLPLQVDQANMDKPRAATPEVILISSDSSNQTNSKQSQNLNPPTGNTNEQPLPKESMTGTAGQQTQSKSLLEKLGLKTEVYAPQPSVGSDKYVSHISETLQMFARELPFEECFRPVEVSRDVKVLERGHWLMIVTIVPDEVAEAARSEKDPDEGKTMRERFPGATATQRLDKYFEAEKKGNLPSQRRFVQTSEVKAQGLWTEGELGRFWTDFASFLEKGRAGWGVSMVGEDISDESSGKGRRLRIRIFTWGEVVGHMYLALYVISEKLIARIPMQWVAADGSHIVKMSGTKFGRGTLPAWSRKGPEGEKGVWGV